MWVIPKPIRRALHLAAGERLQLEFAAGAITLRPPRSGPVSASRSPRRR